MVATVPTPARSGPGNALLSGARTTSLVFAGIWAATWAAEAGFALWVRHSSKTQPSQ